MMNFNPAPVSLQLNGETYENMLSGEKVSGKLDLQAYGVEVLKA